MWKILSAKADLEGNRVNRLQIGPSYVFALPAGHYLATTAKFGDAYAEKEIEIKPEMASPIPSTSTPARSSSVPCSPRAASLAKDIVWKILLAKADLEGNRKPSRL
ncbi:MAG: hypothetical protein U1F68_00725 [Gammaproteobacteria bacterium]